ncbi:DNA-binding transcriptional regulator, LysR family [Salinihabitans flavidus]|uniref:DNA-binding transcriptional regulator, LysR family n=1 Tax=Salinihabitans flavidus TaxID=569882 RepID=A0A1H8PUL8_9RHOB|nr:LysR substrate-binding domain-containing protein [Salinihabitans flavidus]SEO45476.1 DNA-binding transcriptional regulator, LysR family [Salinihabitans flavidus]
MIAPRRFLPSINALLALEAVDRLGSASAAARELSLTQSAISRQLRKLEEQMGAPLVDRTSPRLSLTPAGADYVASVRQVLTQLAQSSLKLRANPRGGSLDLSILPAFSMYWLAPRLRDFTARHPEITLNLNTRLRPFDFGAEPFHAAFHFGRRNWSDVHYLPLWAETVVPVAAPDLTPAPVTAPGDLLSLPLLHLESRPDAWERWFAARDVPSPALSGMLFDQFSTMTQAAIHGLGVALVPSFLAEADIASGRLIEVSAAPRISLGQYYLVWPEAHDSYPPLVSFRRWLSKQLTS